MSWGELEAELAADNLMANDLERLGVTVSYGEEWRKRVKVKHFDKTVLERVTYRRELWHLPAANGHGPITVTIKGSFDAYSYLRYHEGRHLPQPPPRRKLIEPDIDVLHAELTKRFPGLYPAVLERARKLAEI